MSCSSTRTSPRSSATSPEVIRLAESAEAERHEKRPATYPRYDLDDSDRPLRPTPAREELLDFLRALPEETVAVLYSVYRSGDRHRPGPAEAEERSRTTFSLAKRPIHRLHGAHDLAAKALLDSGLRRGLENLGLRLVASRAGATTDEVPPTL